MQANLERFVEHSFDAFSVLYGEVLPGAVYGDALGPRDTHAPHWPLVIYDTEELRRADPDWYENAMVMAAFQDFLDEATEIIRSMVGDNCTCANP